jgi:hypothetical protein
VDDQNLQEDGLKDEEYDRTSTDSINKEVDYNSFEDDTVQLGKLKKTDLKNIKSYLPNSRNKNVPLLQLPPGANSSFLLEARIEDVGKIRSSNMKNSSERKQEEDLDFIPPTFSRKPINYPSQETNIHFNAVESSFLPATSEPEKLNKNHFFDLVASDLKFLFPLNFSFLSSCPEISLPTFKTLICIQDYLLVYYEFFYYFLVFFLKTNSNNVSMKLLPSSLCIKPLLEIEGNDIRSEKDVMQNYSRLFEINEKDINSLNSVNIFPIKLSDIVQNNIMLIFVCDKWGSIYIKRLIKNTGNEIITDFVRELILKFT